MRRLRGTECVMGGNHKTNTFQQTVAIVPAITAGVACVRFQDHDSSRTTPSQLGPDLVERGRKPVRIDAYNTPEVPP